MVNLLLLQGPITWNIPFLCTLLGIAVLYGYIVLYILKMKKTVPQASLFLLSLVLLYVIIGSPLSSLAHLSFSLHMMQMSILYFIIPPMILLGIPNRLFQQIRQMPWMKKVSRLFLPPKLGLIAFAVFFFMYHLPFILIIISQNEIVHNGYMGLLFILSFHMWWTITEADPQQQRKKQFALRSGLFLMPACLVFILGTFWDGFFQSLLAGDNQSFCLAVQADVSALLPPPFNTKFDQLIAGISMMTLHKLGLIMTMKMSESQNVIH